MPQRQGSSVPSMKLIKIWNIRVEASLDKSALSVAGLSK